MCQQRRRRLWPQKGRTKSVMGTGRATKRAHRVAVRRGRGSHFPCPPRAVRCGCLYAHDNKGSPSLDVTCVSCSSVNILFCFQLVFLQHPPKLFFVGLQSHTGRRSSSTTTIFNGLRSATAYRHSRGLIEILFGSHSKFINLTFFFAMVANAETNVVVLVIRFNDLSIYMEEYIHG